MPGVGRVGPPRRHVCRDRWLARTVGLDAIPGAQTGGGPAPATPPDHGDVLAAADCFTVEVWTPRGLTRFTVLILSHLASRRVQIAGISAEPDGPGVTQLMRHAPDAEDGFLRHIRVLIHDRDPRFRPAVREFVAHDHHERNHQGLDNRLILPLSTAPPPRGRVPCRQRLGGMLHYDYRSAA